MPDPYATQKRTKTESQRRILESLRDKPATFTELRGRARVSATILTKHLKELQSSHLVSQRLENGQVLYESTDKAKKTEEAARTVILIGLQNLKSLPQNQESLTFLTDMMALAKDKPEYFQTIMDWLGRLVVFVIGTGKVTWLQSQEARRSFQEAINAREWKPPGEIKTPAELREALDKLGEVIRDVVMTEQKDAKK